MEQCPSCDRQIGWDYGCLDQCRCGYPFWKIEADQLPTGVGIADQWICGRLGLPGARDLPLLKGEVLRDAIAIVERIGWAVTLGYRSVRVRASAADKARARDAGVDALEDWPNRFSRALDRVATNRLAEDRPSGLIGSYGWIYSELADEAPRTAVSRQMRKVLREHAVRHQIVAADEPVFGEAVPRTICMTVAAGLLGMGYDGARALMDGIGAIPAGVRTGVAFPLLPDDVSRALVRKAASKAATGRAIAARLGIGRRQVMMLKAMFDTGDDGLAIRDPGDWASGLMAAIKAKCEIIETQPSGAARLPIASKCVGIPTVEVCQAILSGQLTPLGILRGWPNLGGVVLSIAEVSALRPQHCLSVEQAARALGLHPDSVRYLRRSGVIAGDQARLLATAVHTFGQNYVAASALAAADGTSSRAICRRLAAASIMPSFQPPECRQFIFSRKAVTNRGRRDVIRAV